MPNASKHNNPKNDLFLFLENLRFEMFYKKLLPKDIYQYKLTIFNLLKNYNFSFVRLNGQNITMYLVQNFSFFKNFLDKKDFKNIINKCNINHQDRDGRNIIMYIISHNENQELGFTKDDMILLLKTIDLSHQDVNGCNVLHYIFIFNKTQNLGFTKGDVFNILSDFNLSQKTRNNSSIYDIILNEDQNNVGLFTQQEISLLISKLDIEMTDKNNNNILIKELKNGLCFDSEELVEKILNTENKDIINCVYQHIGQIAWKYDKLFLFFKKNGFKIDDGFQLL